MAGPQVASFVSLNLCGPEVHSIYQWWKQHKVEVEAGLVSVYSAVKTGNNSKPIPVFAAEDEISLEVQIAYDERTDTLQGFCGRKGLDHQCEHDFTVSVGDGEEGYNNIVQAFENLQIDTLARATILNPLVKEYPNL